MSEPHTPKTMTVRELRDLLSSFPDDLLVMRTAPSHDYWGTELALGLSDVATRTVQQDSYHGGFSLPRTDRDEPDDDAFALERYDVLLLG